jgi:hypothetical protein
MNPELRKRIISICERLLAPRVLWPGLLGLFFVITLACWLFRPVPTRNAVLFFPRAGSTRLCGESRPVLPGRAGLEESARIMVEELLLGPADIRFSPALPRGTRVTETLYRRGRLYVDLSEDAVFAVNPSLTEGLSAVRKTLRYNFPTLRSVVLTVEGREPYAVSLEGAEKK